MKLTVVLPCYNAALCLERAVQSIRDQTLADWELLVVDDGSTDDTRGVLERLAGAEPRIRLLGDGINRGPGGARNLAIAAARGDWIALLDADDAWEPDRAERLIAVGEEEGVEIVADNLRLFDQAADVASGTLLPVGFGRKPLKAADILTADARVAGPRWGFLKPLVRRAALERAGIGYAEDIRLSEDLLFLCDPLLSGVEGVLVDTPLYVYTTQRGAISGERSLHSRSPTGSADRLRCAAKLMERHGKTASQADQAALSRFLRAMRAVDGAGRLARLRREGRPLAALALAAARPLAATRYARTSSLWRKWTRDG